MLALCPCVIVYMSVHWQVLRNLQHHLKEVETTLKVADVECEYHH